jgi:predicted amidohydrolase
MATVELAACQAHVSAADYASIDAFDAVLARVGARLDAARARDAGGGFAHPCVAVFPEMIGTFLPLAGRARLVHGAGTTDEAFERVGRAMLPTLARTMLRYRVRSPRVGLLLALAPEVWAIYRRAFAAFARAHATWVVAGSALLPRNAHGDLADAFAPADGRVYNTSYTFAPDGRLVAVARKVNLVPTLEDTLGLSPGEPVELAPVATPFGRLGTLICYDGFDIAHTEREPQFCRLVEHLDQLGCTIVAQPSANPWPWDQRWVFAEPGETQLRREQWLREGLFAQLQRASLRHVRHAITAQLLGNVLDNRFDGTSYLLECGAGGAVTILAQSRRWDADPESEEVVLRAVETDGAPG